MQPRVNPFAPYTRLVPDTIRVTLSDNAVKTFRELFLGRKDDDTINGVVKEKDIDEMMVGLTKFRRGKIAMLHDGFSLSTGKYQFMLKETNRPQGLFEATMFKGVNETDRQLPVVRQQEVRVGYEIKV